MKKIYSLTILLVFLCCSCSKDFLERYDKRIVGTWRITDVNRVGIGGGYSNLPFQSGAFTFFDNGSLDYTNESGTLYKGTWDIDRRYTDDHTHYQLEVTAVDFAGQHILSETYDDMNFSGTNRFKARIYAGLRTYVTHFRR